MKQVVLERINSGTVVSVQACHYIGESVQLNSGGPLLTVTDVKKRGELEDEIMVAWFDTDNRLQTVGGLSSCFRSATGGGRQLSKKPE